MKPFKKNIISVLMLSFAILMSSMVFAQAPQGNRPQKPPVPNEKQVKKMVNKLSEDLDLSEQQSKEVLAIYQEHFADVKEQTSGNKMPKREEMDAMKSSFEKEVKSLLNKEQQTKYKEYLKEQEQNKPKRK